MVRKQLFTALAAIFTVSFVIYSYFVAYYYLFTSKKSSCPIIGPGSSAPANIVEFTENVEAAASFLLKAKISNVIYTSINADAAVHNFHPFFKSLMQNAISAFGLVVFCLDTESCLMCSKVHVKDLCVLMDLGVSNRSMDNIEGGYWKLTYGRVFASRELLKYDLNVLAVDVDAVFINDPFAAGNQIHEAPNQIAVVSDRKPFMFKYGDKQSINGGFLYFPGISQLHRLFSRELVNLVWERNCRPASNEQLVFSSMLRFMSRKYTKNKEFRPYMLSKEKYLNFCSEDCGVAAGSGDAFSNVRSLADLEAFERKHGQEASFRVCAPENRRKWVYFHVACHNKSDLDIRDIARVKGEIQQAILDWTKH